MFVQKICSLSLIQLESRRHPQEITPLRQKTSSGSIFYLNSVFFDYCNSSGCLMLFYIVRMTDCAVNVLECVITDWITDFSVIFSTSCIFFIENG